VYVMFRVAICDDQQEICSQIENIILDYRKDVAIEIDVEVFFTGEELCEFIEKEHDFDLIFLDIELGMIDGIEVARRIRQDMNDEITQILYISSKQSYAMDLFESRPLNFLVKPLSEERIIKYIKQAIQLCEKGNLLFEFRMGKIFYKVPYKDIIYFESNDKKIQIVTVKGGYEYYGKLSDIEQIVPNKDFLLIHKSYLVNYMYVSEAWYDTLKLSNGISLPISQTYRKEVRDILIKRRKGRI
jgi:DNA-binding LytR/AlgR family response regulator